MLHHTGNSSHTNDQQQRQQKQPRKSSLDIKKLTLELTRANVTVRHQAALIYIGLRVSRMFKELWKWLFLHYRRTILDEHKHHPVVKTTKQFKNLFDNLNGAPENLDKRLSRYCSRYENRFLLCTLLACMQPDTETDLYERHINKKMMALHNTTVHSLCSVPTFAFDRYWSCFVVAVTEEAHRMLADPLSEYYSQRNNPLATAYLCEEFSRLLGEFYWQHVQQLTSCDNNNILNGHEEASRSGLRTMLGLYTATNKHQSELDSDFYQHSTHIPDLFARI